MQPIVEPLLMTDDNQPEELNLQVNASEGS